jgi:hypothetical protein
VDFALPSDVEDLRRRVASFVREGILPLEADRANYDEHEKRADVTPQRRLSEGQPRSARTASAAALPLRTAASSVAGYSGST